jgi:CRP-like cAMP-binding protein
MEALINYFNAIQPLSKEDKELMRNHLTCLTLKRGEFAYTTGKVCNRIGFVTEGILRVVEVEESGNEITKYFINEGHFCVDLESYTYELPSREYQEALTDCSMIMISRDTMNLFHAKIPTFTKSVSLITEKALLEKYNIKSELFTADAPTRYAKLLQRNPNIVQRIPLGIISSYLGINQATLSRIRKQIR